MLLPEDYIERGEAVPKPSTVESLRRRKEFKGWTWAFAEVDLAKLSSKAFRINLTITAEERCQGPLPISS
ncbi:type II toxin-antitoxin system HicB family antitoxin [Dyella japonica]|uniref:type II toxin-antitoxin system HicB family antitoxin n=1 Tax=Dyella japonica TaxID=231455 RepID=UPI00069C124F|nr:type II toxin-antitoxin system HicB family antitoxin [Dyella japonica]